MSILGIVAIVRGTNPSCLMHCPRKGICGPLYGTRYLVTSATTTSWTLQGPRVSIMSSIVLITTTVVVCCYRCKWFVWASYSPRGTIVR